MEQYLTDDQDPKTAEKILGKLRDMLTSGEVVVYLAIQKKPAVTLIPDCIAITNKRIIFCIPENLGLTTNFITFPWEDIKEVSFKEEFFGSKFITVPQRGENVAIDYIPKVQARKLYQFSNEQLEKNKSISTTQESDDRRTHLGNSNASEDYTSYVEIEEEEKPFMQAQAPVSMEEPEDEVTLKLKKLKTLFEKQLITSEEYERKKADILSQL
ncbi:PH domain-containing protein [Daejeonella lutea]|uniref:Short C-terminal domain-containing protein n=2 Tax=Daejeonella lutea TaxID=572036 RepID=A0A1T5CZI9_9SPHI|nr:PH domain-containing protein [Daejeonella lutea]SKB64630.1 Short C-terminal domain-containing protein [Daejeonella lutea]